MAGRRIVVSIDFGTTYSGVAWAETSRPGFQNVIETWPTASSTKSSPKVPTELRKVASGHQWGFQIPSTAKRSRAFKLKLDSSSTDSLESDVSPEELTKIYLTFLHKHFMSVLEARLTASVVRATPIDFVVTVPAIWSNIAKQKTQQAAELAGFRGNRKMYLVTEPEAAAIYTLKNLPAGTAAVGSKFVVCDAGGGTVDLIAYEITRMNKLDIKKVTVGTGAKCGSSILNQRFRRHLKRTHGEDYWTNDRLVGAINEFESFKSTFTPDGEPLTLTVDASLGLRRNRYTMSQADMSAKIFEPIVKDVISLVENQIRLAGSRVAAILLVGGFGSSMYLKSRIQQAVTRSIRVLQPENGWTAVVRGAAMLGVIRVNPTLSGVGIASRVARKHYGTCLQAKYDPDEHDESEADWCSKHKCMMVNQMHWFIRKGQSYPEGRPSTIPFRFDIPYLLGEKAGTQLEIFSNENDSTPPIHENGSTKRIATLSLDPDRIPRSTRKAAGKTRIGWHRYYSLNGVVEARYESAMVTYTAKIEGVTHDAISVDYD